MAWLVTNHEDFDPEYDALSPEVQDELLAMMGLLAEVGPKLGRPHADTLNGSKHANMKELRFAAAGGVWRAAFAFDPERKAVLLAIGDKSGVAERRFYKGLIARADRRFDDHLAALARGKE
jgi:hypothetical protein